MMKRQTVVIAATHRLARLVHRCGHALSQSGVHEEHWTEFRDVRAPSLADEIAAIVQSLIKEQAAGAAPAYRATTAMALSTRPLPRGGWPEVAAHLRRQYLASDLHALPLTLVVWYAEQAGEIRTDDIDDEDLALYVGEIAQRSELRERYLRPVLFAAACLVAFEVQEHRGREFVWPRLLDRAPEIGALTMILLSKWGPIRSLVDLENYPDLPEPIAV